MLRIHVTKQDLVNIQLAGKPDPLWETVLSITRLADVPVFSAWRNRARAEVDRHELTEPLRLLRGLVPPKGYFSDFLTPGEAADGIQEGLVAVRRTPRSQLLRDMRFAACERRLPTWTKRLAVADRQTLGDVSEALRLIHDHLVQPDWADVEVQVQADRSRRIDAMREGGIHGLLTSLGPTLTWNPPVLSARYRRPCDLYLRGRGLRLIPSYFCWRSPIVLADADLSPVVVYPIQHAPTWAPRTVRAGHVESLTGLLGHTRARVLAALASPSTTSELAEHLEIASSSASQHATVLREANLISTERTGMSVVHTLSPLGVALLAGDLP